MAGNVLTRSYAIEEEFAAMMNKLAGAVGIDVRSS